MPKLDGLILELLESVARHWLLSTQRPKPAEDELRYWDDLIDKWCLKDTAPLLYRKSSRKGQSEAHQTGREIVFTDNSPANWAFSCALTHLRPALGDVVSGLKAGVVPVGMMFSSTERKSLPYSGSLSRMSDPPNLNAKGWTVCHIEKVSLKQLKSVTGSALEELRAHMKRFLSPRNMFLVPSDHAGLGELPEVVSAFARNPYGRGPASPQMKTHLVSSPERSSKMKTQRDMMRELYRRFGQDEEQVVREYAAAEDRGEVERKSNSHDYNTLQYARALWRDGVRKGWIYGS